MGGREVPDTWERGDSYERYVGRWSRQVAPRFLSWLNIPAGRRWLDVGCGTGALSAAIVDQCSPSSVAAVEPSAEFLNTARGRLPSMVTLHSGDAVQIPLDDASVDVVVSGLVLNFVPDALSGLAEMKRVATRDATIAAYVWDYAGKMELIRFFWDAAVELDPIAMKLDEGVRFPLCRSEALARLFNNGGLHDVEVKSIDIPTPFENFEEYWIPFLGGQGPAPAYAMSLDKVSRLRLQDHLKERMPVQADGSILLTARAWSVRGKVATNDPGGGS